MFKIKKNSTLDQWILISGYLIGVAIVGYLATISAKWINSFFNLPR